MVYVFYKNLVECIRITFDHRISLVYRLFRTLGEFLKTNKNGKLKTSYKFGKYRKETAKIFVSDITTVMHTVITQSAHDFLGSSLKVR